MLKLSDLQSAIASALKDNGLVPAQVPTATATVTSSEVHDAVRAALFDHSVNKGDLNSVENDLYDMHQKIMACPIGNDHVNIFKFRSLEMTVEQSLKNKSHTFQYVNLASLLRHAPNSVEKPRLLAFDSAGRPCLSDDVPTKKISSLAEWDEAFRILIALYLSHPAMSAEDKVKLAYNMNSYMAWIHRQASTMDWVYYDEMYRTYLQTSSDWQNGSAFSGYDLELKNYAMEWFAEKQRQLPFMSKGRSASFPSCIEQIKSYL